MKFWVLLLVVTLSGCSGSGSVKDSGPTQALDMSHVPDAVPRQEVRTRAGNKSPYTVLGKTYRLLPSSVGYREEGGASWYGNKFHGRRTSNGEVYDMYGMTAAHKTLPIPSYVKVTHLGNGREIIVRVNDRGPFHGGRIIDLSYAAASKLGFAQQGTANVLVEAVGPGDQLNQYEPEVSTLNASPGVPLAAKAPEQGAKNTAVKLEVTRDVAVSSAATVYALPGNTYLQAGAFSNLGSAQAVESRIKQLTSVAVSVQSLARDKLFRVRIGPVENNQQLMTLRRLLSENKLPVPHVVYE